MQAKCPVSAGGRDPTDLGGQTSTTDGDLVLPLLYVSKVLFHPVLTGFVVYITWTMEFLLQQPKLPETPVEG